jgi:Fic family protein
LTDPWQPDRPYNELPPLPPAVDLETKAVLKQCITARAALAELKKAVEMIPNPAMLINTLPVLEARASSEIENIVTTADRLFRHLAAEGEADPATKEALRYRHALLEGFNDLRSHPLSTRTAETVCSRIKGITLGVRRIPGTALANAVSGEVIYTPPVTEDRIRTLLANWETFLHRHEEIDPLVRMAAAHYQFEAIHPFTDGNGRTGRVLNSLFLVEQRLLPLPVLYMSRYIITNKADYYELLINVTRRGEWEPWVLFMLRGVEETSIWTTKKIAAIRELADHTAAFVREKLPKIYSRELVDILFEQPYCRIANLVEAGIVGRQAASRYLKGLTSIGVLVEQAVGREKLFTHPRLLALLTSDAPPEDKWDRP